MDTKTPPIPQKQHLERTKFKTPNSGRQVQVSLPPLTPPPNRRQRLKTPGSPWARSGYSAPGIYPSNGNSTKSHQTERPYRVLHIGATPLMHACQQADRSRVLRLLKEQRETIGYRDRTLRSALHYCMDAGTGGAVVTAAPELVNAPDAEGHTPLHLAVIAGDSQLVAVLLANGADVNAKDLEGHSVLHWATVCGEVECVRLVLAAGGRPSTPDMRGGSPLHYAAQCCGAAAPTELAVPKKVGLKVLQSLIDYGANCNAKDEDGRQPILWAASAGSVEAVLALARAGGSAAAGASDKDGLTALHCAASRGHAGCVEALVNLCGSQPDHVDDNGCSALHYAATLGHADATALLLRLGADPNRQDRKGRTPALCAAAKGQLETLKLLAQHGGSLYARTVRGSGVAHESAASGRIELIKWLAKKRPGILDTATHDGRTPLHVAALHGHVDACKVLLDNGARVNAVLRTTKGSQMTPLDAALYRGHRDCAKLIQMHGGTNAQHIKSRKGLSHKEFAATLRLKRRESSSESDVEVPIRRRRRRRGSRSSPDHQYYEERWEERKSTRRRRSDHGGSRSYSDQDDLGSDTRYLSKKKSTVKNRNRQRRARSESARYEEDRENVEEINKRHKKRLGRNPKGRKHEYNESSTELGSFVEGENYSDEEETENRSVSDLETAVSDDSLEVVIVKKSVEKTSERVEMSGRKPREDKETKRSKSRREKKETFRKKTKDKSPGSKKSKSPKTNHEEPRQNQEEEIKERKMRYHIETADSTSQEAVERVTVTVMVHKDNNSDTPKTVSTESSKNEEEAVEEVEKVEEVEEEEPKKKTRPKSARPGSRGSRVSSARTRMDHILEKADEMQSALVQKAADLKKGIDEMREQISSDHNEEPKLEGAEGSKEGGVFEADDDIGKKDVEAKKENEELKSESKSDDPHPEKVEIKSEEVLEDRAKTEEELPHSDSQKSSLTPEVVEVGSPSVSSAGKPENDEVAASDVEGNVQDRSSRRKSVSSSSKSRPSTAGRKSSGSQVERKSSSRSESRASKRGSGKPVDEDDGICEKDEGENDRIKPTDVRSDTGGSGDEVKAASLSKPSEKKITVINSESSLEESNLPELTEEEQEEKAEEISKTVDDQATSSSRRSNSGSGSQKSADRSRSQSQSRPSTAKQRARPSSSSSASKSRIKKRNRSEELSSPNRTTAIVAVIESSEWPEDEEDEEIDNEIRNAIGDYPEPDTDPDDNNVGVIRVLPNTSDEETPRTIGFSRTSAVDSLPQVAPRPRPRLLGVLQSPVKEDLGRRSERYRRDSGGRDSGIEPSPRISKIPKRSNSRRYPNTEKQQSLNMETVTRDVQISLRRYHLERKIFFQLMELKRLQIRHGRANEQVLVKRQVEAFHRAGTTGPTLGVAKYDQPLTFRHFESFLYEQLRRLQRRPATPEWCTGAKQCTQKTHRCHHATSAYTSLPVYTYLGVTGDRGGNLLPNIEGRGKGQMTVEVTHGEDKQVIALPAERLDRSKRYFVTFTVRGESQRREKLENEKTALTQLSASGNQRNAKSV